MSASRVIGAAALLAAVLLYSRRASAATNPAPFVVPYTPPVFDDMPDLTFPEPVMTNDQILNQQARNLRAFLYAIRSSEHRAADVADMTDYYTFFGGARFTNISDHPVATRERLGVRLSDEMCRRAGFGPGCVSTAAGAYQFILPTWQRMRAAAGGLPHLPDFSPSSQDEAARRLLAQIGALPAVLRGDWPIALQLSARQWASLPGSTAGQGGRDMPFVLARIADSLRQA